MAFRLGHRPHHTQSSPGSCCPDADRSSACPPYGYARAYRPTCAPSPASTACSYPSRRSHSRTSCPDHPHLALPRWHDSHPCRYPPTAHVMPSKYRNSLLRTYTPLSCNRYPQSSCERPSGYLPSPYNSLHRQSPPVRSYTRSRRLHEPAGPVQSYCPR